MKWFRQFQSKRREMQRQKLLHLIGRDIEIIATDAYREGCYVTEKRMRLEKEAEFRHLMAHNEKLQELMVERSAFDCLTAITLPPSVEMG